MGLPRRFDDRTQMPVGEGIGLVYIILVLLGGGDWRTPSNPALFPLIQSTRGIGMLLAMVWTTWVGIVLPRRRT